MKEEEKQQTLANGTKVVFLFKGMQLDWEDEEEGNVIEPLTEETFEIPELDGMVFEVESLETYTELGERDYEYYNLKNGRFKMIGCSGYHLKPLLTEPELMDLMSMVDDKLTPDQIQQLFIMKHQVYNIRDLIRLINEM